MNSMGKMATKFDHLIVVFATISLLTISAFPSPTLSENQDAEVVGSSTADAEVDQCVGDDCRHDRSYYVANLPLYQVPGVEVGHKQEMELAPGQFFTVITRSLRPLLFEIPHFLSNEDCDHIVSLAKKKELFNSTTLEDLEEYDEEAEEIDMEMEELFKGLDEDKNGFLDIEEIINSLEVAHGGFFSPNDIRQMYKDLHMDHDGDDMLNVKEFVALNETSIREWMDERTSNSGANKIRHSKQTWLQQTTTDNPVLRALRERVIKLTRLPRNVIEYSEQLQVVYYEVGGHYHAHYDSEDREIGPNITCGQMGFNYTDHTNMTYRLCRYMTILYYLNDVEDGGETAFPVANNETFTVETLRAAGNRLYDLSSHCLDSNVVVKPEKGKAVMWYNHYVDGETGWIGDMDNYTLHGGCDVHRGTKWIANNWINVADTPEQQAAFDKYMTDVYRKEKEEGEGQEVHGCRRRARRRCGKLGH
ncbi:transmembrane prolyl 4-hydroxylase-like [Ptychodera flava]|uniref:transmembrane prolyl 4-hydroxylase-like n=1 Tax=Ptychodera flava TaxID=63121 RepID=UPI00396A8089